MLHHKRTLFRQKSLERLSSPERLDELLQVVSAKSWLPLASLSSLVVAALIWGIYGRIPITVEGRGVLIYPSKVVPLQSKSAGQLLTLNVKVGDVVKKGDVIGTINQAELRKQLQQQRAKLAELDSQDQAVGSLQQQRIEQEKRFIQQQRQYLEQRIAELEALTPLLKAKSSDSIVEQRQGLQERLQREQALSPNIKERMEARKKLFKEEGAISSDLVLDAEQEYLRSLESISDLKAQLKELDVKQTQEEKTYRENLSSISDFRAQLRELDSREANLAKENLETTTTRKKEIQEVKREIAKLELQLSDDSQVISQHSGRILELTVHPGEFLNEGVRLGSIDAENTASKLVGVSYFPVGDGKKIQQGMTVQITPQTVKRERFGGIVGTVTSISPFPVTKEAAINQVGNPEVVEGLVGEKQEGVMQVAADLELNPTTFSGYKWSSSTGPQLNISPGTTTIVRVKVEERAPITFVLPILRSYSGIY
jgi:HlyD family secretion protein